jgi:DNA-binding NtrC family response regulator
MHLKSTSNCLIKQAVNCLNGSQGETPMKYEVMVVDDELNILHTVKRILEESGFLVRTALGGKECIRELGKGFKGIILMDVVMPEMTGYETIETIIENGMAENILFCMLTGQDYPEKRLEKHQDYVIDYLRKPIDTTRLIPSVTQYLKYLKER